MKRTPWGASLALALAFALILPAPAGWSAPPVPQSIDLHPPVPPAEYRVPPAVSATSWIVFDATDGVVLGSEGADVVRPMASTTKMMSAIVALDNADPDQVVEISQRAADVGEAEIGLVAGERLRLGDLITAMVVRSANDAAIAVAEAVAGDVETFVEMMNARASELGLETTSFANPHGLDAEGHHSTARDLLRLALVAMADERFAEMARTTTVAFPPAPDGTERIAEATNLLLGEYEGAIGVKTGFTFQAGLVFVAAAEREGRTVYAVVMGSEGPRQHFRDATALLDHGFAGHGLVRAAAGEVLVDGSRLRRLAGLEAALHVATLVASSDSTGSVSAAPPTEPVATEPLPALSDAWLWLLGALDG